ncbi:twin-arginine translocase subunit TatC [Tenacibaculum maritimum]|uniref:twin-arginine translocase subunit TatC n=1 Tax=Tenacibaculum maritimum TaxID=107401 RepID=UPI0010A32AD3|nr:twin-arginine translocase subunit TatC [Tenacibaculum maritimum]MCD9561568.1 twin-arginine translocase subunit TatC [Tenacibaculum maritimum]MCD9565411.1 twin-arginine translocase subunit TatC [Tenacibaculum maritimum]MCD9579249.1 twin-arginine translocase subunit TatC [Tenacibaculum maritimum]MCD9582467.1 twin-arginine translocase subunit TatC [Tenacibaculum maritimum]MCD9584301.1 twin-arginine translocase subunit TatC [Tenacibaculum maritimum]
MTKQQDEMSFLGHLEELRWHLVRSFTAVFIIAILLFIFQEWVFNYYLLAHLNPDFITYKFFCKTFASIGIDSSFCNINFKGELQSLALTQQLMTAIWTSLILGFIIAFPYILWEIWRFISPGLHDEERKKSKGFIFIASLLFFLGALFSYFVIVPMSVSFFYGYQISDKISNNFTIDSYTDLVNNTLLGVSIMFELPVLIFFLSKIGLITPDFLRKYRKHALVLVLIVAAIITPPDVASQVIVSIPILILYEISIYVSKFVIKKQQNA